MAIFRNLWSYSDFNPLSYLKSNAKVALRGKKRSDNTFAKVVMAHSKTYSYFTGLINPINKTGLFKLNGRRI